MKNRKINIITAVICTAALSAASFFSGYAAAADSDTGYGSRGKIVFDNGTEDTVDDVVFDASDFFVIDGMVRDGKDSIRDSLNEYDSINIDEEIPAFDSLAAGIASISEGTDAGEENILSGKKALVGKSIITGSMTDHSNSKTPADNITEKDNEVEITIPGGYYDGDSKVTVPIETVKNKIPSLSGCNVKMGGGGGTFTLSFDPVLVVAYGEGNGKPVIAWRYKDGSGQGVAGYNGDTSPSVTISGRTITVGSWCTNGWIAVG